MDSRRRVNSGVRLLLNVTTFACLLLRIKRKIRLEFQGRIRSYVETS